jgi:hypothetical protein
VRTFCQVWAGRFDATLERPFDAHVSLAERIVREVIAALGRDRATSFPALEATAGAATY